MKKITALVLSLMLTLTALSACSEKPSGLVYELTGIAPGETLLTVEGRDVPAEMYCYWALYATDYVLSNYTTEFTNADGSVKWDAEWDEGMTLQESVLEETLNTAKMYMIVEKWAEDYGVTLDEKSEQAMEEDLAAMAEKMGGHDAFVNYLAQRGITEETNRRMSSIFYLYANMLSLVKEEDSPLYLSDDVLYQYDDITEDTVLADHILILYPEDEEGKAKVRENMQVLRDEICSQEDPVEAFNFIADNYSEDTGRAYYPNGYLVTEDANFVQSFKDAALSLEEYEISDLVESEYGCHIIMRKPLRDYVADQYLGELITVAIENAEVEWSKAYEKFDLPTFYAGYRERLDAATAAAGDENADDAAAGDESGNDAG